MKRNPKIMFIVASRPNFMKIAPLVKEAQKQKVEMSIFYTEQHKSKTMTGDVAKELEVPEPDYSLGLKNKAKNGSKIIKGLAFIRSVMEARRIIKRDNPSVIVVVGDVVSSAYIALIARNTGFPVAHVEAGLRSFNMKMPEERARKIIDRISDLLFIPEEIARINLLKEGKEKERIHFVGNIMIDSLKKHIAKSKRDHCHKKFGLKKNEYGVITFHRHENITNKFRLKFFIKSLKLMSKEIKLIFPLHPSTKKQLIKSGLIGKLLEVNNLKIVEPVGYGEMLSLIFDSKFVVTDSGGIQEEATYLGVPCLTMRTETERPITVEIGTNTVIGFNEEKLQDNLSQIINKQYKKGKIPPLWDGKTAERIIKVIKNGYNL